MGTSLYIALCMSIFSLFHISAISEMNNEIIVQSAPGQATDYLTPGSESLNYSYLTPGERSYIVFVENDSERVFVGTMKERLVETTKEDSPFMLRIQELHTDYITRESMVMADVNACDIVFDAITDYHLSATHYYTKDIEIVGDFIFSDKQTESVRTQVKFPVFSAEAVDMIIRSIPLFDGYQAHFVGFDHSKTDLFTPITLTVEKLETITVHEGKTHRAWRVKVLNEDSKMTYYVDKYSREIVRIEFEQSPGILLVMEQF